MYSVDVANSQIIMEFLEGMTLEQALRNKDFEKNLVGTAELLASIHSLGVIHGDPTTSNFIVNEKIHAIDFGNLSGKREETREISVEYSYKSLKIDGVDFATP